MVGGEVGGVCSTDAGVVGSLAPSVLAGGVLPPVLSAHAKPVWANIAIAVPNTTTFMIR